MCNNDNSDFKSVKAYIFTHTKYNFLIAIPLLLVIYFLHSNITAYISIIIGGTMLLNRITEAFRIPVFRRYFYLILPQVILLVLYFIVFWKRPY